MTKAEYAQRQAIQARYGERIRWEERQRAFDIIEMRVPDDNEEAAELLWNVAAEIMRSKQIAEWDKEEPRDDWWQYQRDFAQAYDVLREASPEQADQADVLREALKEAYRKGASDVHNYWVENPGEPPRGDPEFGEAASDYAEAALDIFDSSARAALKAQEG